jgi:hypothetical protein
MQLWALAAVGAIVCLSGCDRIPGTSQSKAATSIRSGMFDPGAAKITFSNETHHAVCGTVNGKNRMGAYVGATPFLYDKATGATLVYGGQPDSNEVRRLAGTDSSDPEWNKLFLDIAAKCAFPNEWAMNCKTAMPAEGEGHICQVWRSDGNGPTKIMDELSPRAY